MKRIVAMLAALALVAIVAAPASASQFTIRSATVDQYGVVMVTGTVVCPEGDQFGISGNMTQAVSRKVIVQGYGDGWGVCASGLTTWSLSMVANSNRFTTGWATVGIDMGAGGCDPEYGCWGWNDGGQFVVKVTRK